MDFSSYTDSNISKTTEMNVSRSTEDPHSFAKPELARVIHTHLELIVDFNRKVLKGTASLTIESASLIINEIILDNLGLVISSVTDMSNGTHLNYYNKINYAFGSSLCVQLPYTAGATYNTLCRIQIEYETTPYSPALCWLTPAQTADGLYPFLMSNNKLIHARAWFPCQDIPSVKFTYSATISVPKNFKVVTSAHLESICEGPEIAVYTFLQSRPVPSYAVIIAVGSLEKRRLNNRTDVFAENKFIDTCMNTFHFAMIETMLEIAERLCGPYMWGRYDICVLPPSVAHFEIECPCVIFISPTLLGGDRSSIRKLARNVSQSWAGNLVTCSNYEHLWLNKSFSIFISRKIESKIWFCEDIKSYLEREGLTNLNAIIQNLSNIGLLRCLLPNLTGWSPHRAIKYVPYEVGYVLLDYLENMLGGPSVFEPFLKHYFCKLAFKSINTTDWINYLNAYFFDKKMTLDCVEWNSWFYNIPSASILPGVTARETKCFDLAREWVKWDNNTHSIPSMTYGDLDDAEKIIFLNYLLFYFHTDLCTEKLESISHCYSLDSRNGEIRFVWLLLCIKIRWAEKVESALKFATEYCSPNYAYPIFQHLYEWTKMRKIVIETYKTNKEKMLHKTQEELDTILHLNL